MDYIQPKNWGEFQHYKDRSPTWIKLHKSILDNYEYQCLPLASRALAPMLWLLASEYEQGKIPADLKRIAFRVRVSVKDLQEALSPLIDSGFFVGYHDASEVLAECLPREEKRREREREEKEESTVKPNGLPLPHKKIQSRKTSLPENFGLSDRVRQWAGEKGYTRLDERLEHFVSKAKSNGYTYVDWDEAFMGAIRDDWAKLPPVKLQSVARQAL